MSDVSQGEGWWVASDGKWYPPHLHPEYRPATPSESPVVQVATSSDAADEPSMERSAIAVATAQRCVNGHDMPESQVSCSVCGSGRFEVPLDFSAPVPDKPQGWLRKHSLAVIVAVAVLAAAGIGVGFSGGSSSSTPSKSSNTPTAQAAPDTWTLDWNHITRDLSTVENDLNDNASPQQVSHDGTTLLVDVRTGPPWVRWRLSRFDLRGTGWSRLTAVCMISAAL
jgi:hypothetical protein